MTNEVIQNILTRCSVRAYDDRPVEREKIDTLLQCAVHAPSAMNRQTWHFSAVLNREKICFITSFLGHIRVWDYPNKQNARAVPRAARAFLANGYSFAVLAM